MTYCKSWLTDMSSRPFPPRRRGELLLEFLQVTRGRDGGPRNVLVGPANDLPEHREKLGAQGDVEGHEDTKTLDDRNRQVRSLASGPRWRTQMNRCIVRRFRFTRPKEAPASAADRN